MKKTDPAELPVIDFTLDDDQPIDFPFDDLQWIDFQLTDDEPIDFPELDQSEIDQLMENWP